jgi:hypothetical protein
VVVHTHFNTAQEITEHSRLAMDRMLDRGITVRNQAVLQKGVNDTADGMVALVRGLSYINVHPYYVYMHDLVKGVEDLRTSVDTALFIEKHVRGSTAGFNTPTWSGNIQFGNREVLPNFGFNVVWKWQDTFLWQTPLAEGVVSSFNTVDAQVSLQVPQWNASFKLGGTNLANNRYIQYAAGPTIGALYYLSVTWDIWKK